MDEKRLCENHEKRISQNEIDIVKLNGRIDNLNKLTITLDKLVNAVNELNLAGVNNENNFKVIDGKLDDIYLKLDRSEKKYEQLERQRNQDHEKKPLEIFGKVTWVIVNAILIYLLSKLGLK